MKEIRTFAKKNELASSWTYYHGWAKAKDKSYGSASRELRL
jgi:hypothetical protein